MKILAHRGLWNSTEGQNTVQAFASARNSGFGIELDVRDQAGGLVISHDVPQESALPLDSVISSLAGMGPLAINVKSDGLSVQLRGAIDKAGINDYFVFDMSVPELRRYIQLDFKIFTRASEVEREPAWLDLCEGVWLDAFDDDNWHDIDRVRRWFDQGKKICFVSPELHARAHEEFWNRISSFHEFSESILICTDYPFEAKSFFKELL